MRFFMYNGEIINLTQVSNFTCEEEFAVTEEKDPNFQLSANLNYSHGFWEREENNIQASILLGVFETKEDALNVIKDILAGIYDLPCVQPVKPQASKTPEAPENATVEEATESTTATVEQPENQEEKEKIMEGARELFKHEQTSTIAKNIGIDKIKIYSEAQRIWGDSDEWTTETWQKYVKAIADFHQEKGVLYDKLKPRTQQTEPKDEKGPF